MQKEIPGERWYNSQDKFAAKQYRHAVIFDIMINGIVFEKCLPFIRSFIKFACSERLHYKPDIADELDCYMKRRRMEEVNVKNWLVIRLQVFERDNYTCQYCEKRGGKLEADHVIPYSKGGSDELDNLLTSCRRCNRQKKDKFVEEFMLWRVSKN